MIAAAMSVAWRILSFCIPIPIAFILAAGVWMHIDKGATVRAALRDYVSGAEIAALESQLAERERQRAAAELAAHSLRMELEDQAESAEAQAYQLEREIDEYEKKLADEGRICTLDDRDIEWLSNH